jgi:hypothetical protein
LNHPVVSVVAGKFSTVTTVLLKKRPTIADVLAMRVVLASLAILILPGLVPAQTPVDSQSSGLKDATVLIIRHAEKPDSGNTLAPAGELRARAYVHYFQTFTLDSAPCKPDSLFAATDSKNSHRPRLTLQPLATALGIKLDTRFEDKQPEALASELRSGSHGSHILICWHHGEIPALLRAFGADPAQLLPGGQWPPQTFDWLIELRYDHEGRLIPSETRRINENLLPGDSK